MALAYPVFLFMENNEQNVSIKAWPQADRPREKLLLHGRRHLSNAELIAILIRSGTITETAVNLGKRILNGYANDLDILGTASVADLVKFNGIGEAKALCIVAALELSRRRNELVKKERVKIISSRDVFEYMLPVYADLHHEEFWVLLLNRANFVISKQQISKGGQAGTVADPKIIFKIALEQKAASIVLTHNHPSGNLTASQEDLAITKKLMAAGKLLDLPVVDHLIMTNKSFYSLCDEGVV